MNRFWLAFLAGSMALMPFASAFAIEAPAEYKPPQMEDMVKLEVYQNLKDFYDVTLTQENEGVARLSEFKGKIIVFNVWATWCPPCVKELPSLNALQLAMGDTLQVITVSLDKGVEGQAAAKKFMLDNNLTALTPYVDGFDDVPKIEAMRDVPGIPVTFILDKSMRVLARYQGDADWNGRAARAVLDYYIKNTPEYNLYENVLKNRPDSH